MRHLDDMLGQTQILTSGVGDYGLPYLALLSSVPALSPTQEHNAWVLHNGLSLEPEGAGWYDSGVSWDEGRCLAAKDLSGRRER